MSKAEREQGIAPDRISDVAEWGDRKVLGKDFKDMTPEELAAAEQGAKRIRALREKLGHAESAAKSDGLRAAGWDESEHPRHPGGSEAGGQFAADDADEGMVDEGEYGGEDEAAPGEDFNLGDVISLAGDEVARKHGYRRVGRAEFEEDVESWNVEDAVVAHHAYDSPLEAWKKDEKNYLVRHSGEEEYGPTHQVPRFFLVVDGEGDEVDAGQGFGSDLDEEALQELREDIESLWA